MATRRKNAGKSSSRPSRRQAAPEPVAEDTIEEVKTGGMGIDDGIVLSTTIILVVACVLMYMTAQKYAVA